MPGTVWCLPLLRWRRVLRDEFVEARFEGQDTGRSARLAEVLAQAIAE